MFKGINELLNQDTPSTKIGQGKSALVFLRLCREWENIIGPRLAQHSAPLKQAGHSLTILTSHSAFSEQLKYLEREIIKKIETQISYYKSYPIKSLSFIAKESFFTQKKALTPSEDQNTQEELVLPHKFSPEYKMLKAQAKEYFKDIKDQEIRESLESLYIQRTYSQNHDSSSSV